MSSDEGMIADNFQYIKNFPKLKSQLGFSEFRVYEILTKVPSCKYYKWNKKDVKAVLKREEAFKLFTYLALQNERNKSLLERVSEGQASLESEHVIIDDFSDSNGGECVFDEPQRA